MRPSAALYGQPSLLNADVMSLGAHTRYIMRMPIIGGLVALCAMLGCHAPPARLLLQPAPNRAALSGQVRASSRGAPLQGVAVRLTDETRTTRDSTITDADGRFTFASLLPGSYRVEYLRIGFARQQRTLELKAGRHLQDGVALLRTPVPVHADCLAPDGRSMGAQYCR